jgi:hypothetical protein
MAMTQERVVREPLWIARGLVPDPLSDLVLPYSQGTTAQGKLEIESLQKSWKTVPKHG